MPLTRKIHNSGRSIIVTIPSQLVEAFDFNCGDLVEIIPIKNGEIKIKKIENKQTTEVKSWEKK
jgi:antitoxin component of MazEF toxin-antitoxin module